MKVLHVITGLDAGGAELQLAMLLRHTRHESEVVTLYNPGPVAEQIRAAGTPVHDLAMRSNREPSALLRLGRIVRDGRYDAVHAHLYRSQVYARPVARLAGTPVVVTTEHSIGETHIERRPMTRGVRALYLASERFSDATIAVSDIVRDRLVRWGVPEQKITVIPNAVETSGLTFDPVARERARGQFGLAPDVFVIGSLGRLDPNKRVGLTIEAAAPLLGDRCKLLVVGRGEEQDRIAATAAGLGVAEHVILAGYQVDTAAMMSAFDLYVAMSAQETFGLSVLEALASGLPVLYTTCPALDGIETARASKIGDSVAGLRAEIRARSERPDRSRQVPAEVFEFYGVRTVVARIDDLYERVLLDHPRRARPSDRLGRSPAAEVPRPAAEPRPVPEPRSAAEPRSASRA